MTPDPRVMPTQSIVASFFRERNEADLQMRPIIHIRITTDAIAGSVVAVPVSPERARTLGRLVALPNDTVEAAFDGRALEILVHPEDWISLLKEMPADNGFAVQHGMKPGEPTRVLGIPVSKS